VKWVLEYPSWTAKSNPTSIATVSAQPILRPSESQPLENFQASHTPLKTMPIPQEDDASTQKSIGEMGGGLDNMEPQKSLASWLRHHSISVRTLGLGVRRTNSDDEKLKDAAKQEREGRCYRPSGIAKEQWTSVPTTDSTSFLANFWPSCQGSSFIR
jgi:hypothetical protein